MRRTAPVDPCFLAELDPILRHQVAPDGPLKGDAARMDVAFYPTLRGQGDDAGGRKVAVDTPSRLMLPAVMLASTTLSVETTTSPLTEISPFRWP